MEKIALVFRDKNKKYWNKVSKEIKDIFYNSEITSFWKNSLKKNDFKEKDLIITIGGDGTFLSASHFIKDQLIIGINDKPTRSEGALTSIKIGDVKRKLKRILKKRFKIINATRIEVKLLQKNKCILTELALNEIYIGNINPQHTSKYKINFKNKIEKQTSSGILISTGTGSSAWYKSMGGKVFSKTKKIAKFMIRELYVRKLNKPKMKKGTIKENESLEIENFVNHNIIAIDSIRKYDLKKNEKAIISIGKPLRIIKL